MDKQAFDSLMKLKEILLHQAEYFLQQAREFFPFGAVINSDDSISPLGVYLEEDRPESLKVIDELYKGITYGFKEKKYKFAAICIDVFVTQGNLKRSALEMRFLSPDSAIATFRTFYELTQEGKLLYDDLQLIAE